MVARKDISALLLSFISPFSVEKSWQTGKDEQRLDLRVHIPRAPSELVPIPATGCPGPSPGSEIEGVKFGPLPNVERLEVLGKVLYWTHVLKKSNMESVTGYCFFNLYKLALKESAKLA